jgi:hypothetical protein
LALRPKAAYPNGSDPDRLRIQLAFFAAWSPVFGAVLAAGVARTGRLAAAAGLLALAVPWLLFRNTRPLVGRQPWVTWAPSVLQSSPSTIAFAMYQGSEDEYQAAASALNSGRCRNVGLSMDSHDPEYLIWWLLRAPQSGFRLEHRTTAPGLGDLRDRSFQSCAVLCTICREAGPFEGLPLYASYGTIRVYLIAPP